MPRTSLMSILCSFNGTSYNDDNFIAYFCALKTFYSDVRYLKLMTKVYLAGPINGCTNKECSDWRNHIKNNWHEITPIDPMIRDYRGQENTEYREIVDLDKRDIRNSDIVLVNFPKPSVGTSMEIFYAHSLGIPVIIVIKEGDRISPWLRYHSTAIVHSFPEALDRIEFYG